jgi:HSP90 family molecular chaperone
MIAKMKEFQFQMAYAELILGYALLAEGSELPDPIRFNRLLADMMLQTL